MGKMILITGGARSGKSGYAEDLLKEQSNVLYIATGIPFDDEMKDRISRHRERRNKSWKTAEAYKGLDKIINEINDTEYILLDCITIMINNIMLLDNKFDWDNIRPEEIQKVENSVQKEINALIDGANNFNGQTVIVTNELGMGLVPPDPLSRHYRDIAGRANQMLAEAADEVYLCVSGIPVKIKS